MGWRARKLLRSRAPSGHRIAIRLSECERQCHGGKFVLRRDGCVPEDDADCVLAE